MSSARLHELPIYLPAGWHVKIQSDRLILIAPNQVIAEALRLGAAQSIRATSERLGVPVEIRVEHKGDRPFSAWMSPLPTPRQRRNFLRYTLNIVETDRSYRVDGESVPQAGQVVDIGGKEYIVENVRHVIDVDSAADGIEVLAAEIVVYCRESDRLI